MPRTGQLYIFGDSLSDDGATAVQFLEEPIDAFFAGRASNGLVWHEYIRNDLAVGPAAASISQAPNADGFLSGSDLNGINFAHGGAVSSSTVDPKKPGAVQQAQGFADLVGTGEIPAPDDQDVFVIWIGGNDFLQFGDASLSEFIDILNLDTSIVDNIETAVDTLTSVGARNFVFIGQPTVGGAFLGDTAPAGSLLARLWNELAEDFNDALEDYADSVDDEAGQTALYIDITDLIEDIEDDPESFGFENVTSDIESDGAAFEDQTYFSVDGIHPTGAGHAAIAAYIVESAAAANFDLTALAGNVVPGSDRDDLLVGTDGNDSITGNGGDDTISGGSGVDIAFLGGSETSYTLSIGPEITLADRSGMDGTDRLSDVETLDFLGTTFDLSKLDDAATLSSSDFRALTEVYVSYFNRAPDALGLTFWADAFANGVTLGQIAELFATSQEARAVFPQDLPADDFVSSVYLNTLGRAPDDAGYDFWSEALSIGAVSRAQFVREVLVGARAQPPQDAPEDFVAQQAADRMYLDSKVDIGLYFSAVLGMSDVANATEVMGLFNGSSDSVDTATMAADDTFVTASALDGTGEFLVNLIGIVDDQLLT